LAYRLSGDEATARSTWQSARGELEEMLKASPDDSSLVASLGLVSAGLGDGKEALAFGERAMKLQPTREDAVNGPGFEEQLARIQAQLGEKDQAIAQLARLLKTPYFSPLYGASITPALLRQDPSWNALRADPRFQSLLGSGAIAHR
ncbi:MAG TPA: hypothetical protein VJ722_02220, partial [Rhodanobacteraceae bacterium]|nr:hypothetical protein [Rhodanobacteraceae bacterium]